MMSERRSGATTAAALALFVGTSPVESPPALKRVCDSLL